MQLDIVTAGAPDEDALSALADLAARLLSRHPPLTRVLHTTLAPPPPPSARRRRRRAPPSDDVPPTVVLAAREGRPFVARVARPGGGGGGVLRFEVAPRAFWQVNDGGTDDLLRLAAAAAARGRALAGALASPARLLDLYCGAGLFAVGLLSAGAGGEGEGEEGTSSFAAARGLERGADAVAAARANAARNGVGARARFDEADLAFRGAPPAVLAEALADDGRTELVVVVDPPRAGLGGALRRALRGSAARVLVYVSCDPQTLGRDVAELCGGGGGGEGRPFRLEEVTPVDLTPHAARVECVCLLWRP